MDLTGQKLGPQIGRILGDAVPTGTKIKMHVVHEGTRRLLYRNYYIDLEGVTSSSASSPVRRWDSDNNALGGIQKFESSMIDGIDRIGEPLTPKETIKALLAANVEESGGGFIFLGACSLVTPIFTLAEEMVEHLKGRVSDEAYERAFAQALQQVREGYNRLQLNLVPTELNDKEKRALELSRQHNISRVEFHWRGFRIFAEHTEGGTLQLLSDAISQDPHNPDLYKKRAVLYVRTGAFELAEIDFKKAEEIERYADSPVVHKPHVINDQLQEEKNRDSNHHSASREEKRASTHSPFDKAASSPATEFKVQGLKFKIVLSPIREPIVFSIHRHSPQSIVDDHKLKAISSSPARLINRRDLEKYESRLVIDELYDVAVKFHLFPDEIHSSYQTISSPISSNRGILDGKTAESEYGKDCFRLTSSSSFLLTRREFMKEAGKILILAGADLGGLLLNNIEASERPYKGEMERVMKILEGVLKGEVTSINCLINILEGEEIKARDKKYIMHILTESWIDAKDRKRKDEVERIENILGRIFVDEKIPDSIKAKAGLIVRFDVRQFLYLPEEYLEELYRNRKLNRSDGRPLTVIICARYSEESLLIFGSKSLKEAITSLIEKGYKVLYYEAENVDEFFKNLSEATQLQKASLLIFKGEGIEGTAILLSDRSNFSSYLTARDISENEKYRENLKSSLENEGTVIIFSCHSGDEIKYNPNVAEAIGEAIPQAKDVFGFKGEVSKIKLVFDKSGKVTGIKSDAEIYNAARVRGKKRSLKESNSSPFHLIEFNSISHQAGSPLLLVTGKSSSPATKEHLSTTSPTISLSEGLTRREFIRFIGGVIGGADFGITGEVFAGIFIDEKRKNLVEKVLKNEKLSLREQWREIFSTCNGDTAKAIKVLVDIACEENEQARLVLYNTFSLYGKKMGKR
ncbi:MAG: hypothetical protein DRP76_04575, partial [Candidatus Omnitrophota bacterium]